MENSLRADQWALRKISDYQQGKILLWAWISRGLVDIEWVSGLYFDGDVKACKEALAAVRGKLAEVCKLDSLPLLDGADDPECDDCQPEPLEAEICNFWAICDGDSPAIPLPVWMRGPIDKAILLWRNQLSKWEDRLAKRKFQGKDGLTPAAQKAYDDWSKSRARSIVFDKVRKSEVVKVSSKSIAALKRHCMLLVVHMSDKPEELGVTTGSGKCWNLRLLQQSSPISEQVPVEVDHFQGLSLGCIFLSYMLLYPTVLYCNQHESHFQALYLNMVKTVQLEYGCSHLCRRYASRPACR